MGIRSSSDSMLPREIVGRETLGREIAGWVWGFHGRGLRTVLGSMGMERTCCPYGWPNLLPLSQTRSHLRICDVTKKYIFDKSRKLFLTQWDDIESPFFNYIVPIPIRNGKI